MQYDPITVSYDSSATFISEMKAILTPSVGKPQCHRWWSAVVVRSIFAVSVRLAKQCLAATTPNTGYVQEDSEYDRRNMIRHPI